MNFLHKSNGRNAKRHQVIVDSFVVLVDVVGVVVGVVVVLFCMVQVADRRESHRFGA